MTKYKFTICCNEAHFNHIVNVLGSKGYVCNIRWDTLKDKYKDAPDLDLALFWAIEPVDRNKDIAWGNTAYGDNRNYLREDIEILPDDLFTL